MPHTPFVALAIASGCTAGVSGVGGQSSPDAAVIGSAMHDGGVDSGDFDAPSAPSSICGADDTEITSVSTSWGPAWARPDPSRIVEGWPLDRAYELWWVPMPNGTRAYRIHVPSTFQASLVATAAAQIGEIDSYESPSTAVAFYDYSLSETACDLSHGIGTQSSTPPYTVTAFPWPRTANYIVRYFQVRPQSLDHCVPVPGYASSFCLEPGKTYWWNLRLAPGEDPSTVEPEIDVQRPLQDGET